MSQTRKGSATEAIANVVAGYGVSFVANLTIFPLMGWEITIAENLTLGAFYTAVSLVRSYVLRRIFNFMSNKY